MDDYLKISRKEIDDRDLTGKTALAWAASRLDPLPVRILLAHDASLSVTDHRSKTPLHYAAGSGSPEAVEMILQAIREKEKDKAPGTLGLIEAGDDKSRTPLNYATRMDLYPHTELLLRYGASLAATEKKTKRCILLNAIYWNSHKVIPLLLNQGATTDGRDASGATLLHHAARFGDLQTLRILSQCRIGYIDASITDNKGMTAMDTFDSPHARCSPEESETREIAVILFAKILNNAAYGTGRGMSIIEEMLHSNIQELEGDDASAGAQEVEDEEEEVFYDAVS